MTHALQDTQQPAHVAPFRYSDQKHLTALVIEHDVQSGPVRYRGAAISPKSAGTLGSQTREPLVVAAAKWQVLAHGDLKGICDNRVYEAIVPLEIKDLERIARVNESAATEAIFETCKQFKQSVRLIEGLTSRNGYTIGFS